MSSNRKNAVFLVFAAVLSILTTAFFVSGVPKRDTVNRGLQPDERRMVEENENAKRNLSSLNSLPRKEREKIYRNYRDFHKLSRQEQRKIMKNYVDWLQYNADEKAEVKRQHPKFRARQAEKK